MKSVWIRSKGEPSVSVRDALEKALRAEGFRLVSSPKGKVDLAVSIGGDGTFLASLRELGDKRHSVPLLGIHSSPGRGFLLPLHAPREHSELAAWAASVVRAVKKKEFSIEERWGLSGTLYTKDGRVKLKNLWALNDIVVTRSTLSRLVWLRIFVDGKELISKLRGDGLIVASPSGSTAYSMSAGGPVMHPGLKNLMLTFVCPQSLAHRSVVLGSESTVRIEVLENDVPSFLTDDGQAGREMAAGQAVEVKRSGKPVKFLVPTRLAPQYGSFFRLLRDKLGFGVE